jgi:hypothetical protein
MRSSVFTLHFQNINLWILNRLPYSQLNNYKGKCSIYASLCNYIVHSIDVLCSLQVRNVFRFQRDFFDMAALGAAGRPGRGYDDRYRVGTYCTKDIMCMQLSYLRLQSVKKLPKVFFYNSFVLIIVHSFFSSLFL